MKKAFNLILLVLLGLTLTACKSESTAVTETPTDFSSLSGMENGVVVVADEENKESASLLETVKQIRKDESPFPLSYLNLSIEKDKRDFDAFMGNQPKEVQEFFQDQDLPTAILVTHKVVKNAVFQEELPADTEEMKTLLLNKLRLKGFGDSKDISEMKKRIETNKKTIVYFHGYSCPYCDKVNPHLEKYAPEHDDWFKKVDLFVIKNRDDLTELLSTNPYDMPDIPYVPFIVAFENGKAVAHLTSDDWKIENANAELGFDVNEEPIKEFLQKYSK